MYPVLSTTDMTFEVSLLIEERKVSKKPIPERIMGNKIVISIKEIQGRNQT